MSSPERLVLELLTSRLTADGYDVYVDPPRALLPQFMKTYRPDAIALGKPKKLALEVVSNRHPQTARTEDLSQIFANVDDWEFRLYYAPRSSDSDALPLSSVPTIEATLKTVANLTASGEGQAALLLAWSALEALGRLITPEKLSRPQPPENLLNRLAEDGSVTPDEAVLLRRMGELRNRVIHGDLELDVSADDLAKFLDVCGILLTLIEPGQPPAG